MVEQLSPSEVVHRLSDPEHPVVLLDVREEWERALAAIRPSVHIPLQQLPNRLGELPRGVPIVVYCHTGTRSAMAAGFLSGHGFPLVANLSGGIEAWSNTVDPNVPRY